MTNLSCADFEALAPELAMGLVAGGERAAALAHVARCPSCRQELEELAALADALLLLAPEAEPPAGFESNVLERLQPATVARQSPPRPHRARRAIPLVAAVLACLLGLGAGVVVGRSSAPALHMATMRSDVAGWTGRVVALPGTDSRRSSTLFVSATAPVDYTNYTLEVVDRDGRTQRFTGLAIREGRAAWSRTVAGPVSRVHFVRMLSADGGLLCQATFAA